MSTERVTLNWFDPWEGNRWAQPIRAMKGRSGVYAIRSRSSGEVLYVGESHSGSLYRTVVRHFEQWDGPTAGATYSRDHVELALLITPAGEAREIQYQFIEQLEPRDNVIGNEDDDEDLDDEEEDGDVPF
jgi:excinuclease UvrABC nuclease subunit